MATRVLTHTSNDVVRQKEAPETIGAAQTLTAADSGKTFRLVTSGTDGAAVTLPAAESGLKYTFEVGAAFATTNWTIVAPANVIEGYAVVNYATVVAANENTISFVATAETIGDSVTVYCDGTSWNVFGHGSATGSITFTAP